MENPYEPPHTNPHGAEPLAVDPTGIPDRGLIGHVRVLAILMMVQGVLEIVFGLCLAGFAVVMPSMMQGMQGAQGMPKQNANALAQMNTMVVVMYGGMAVVLCAVGGVRIFAGSRNYKLKSRVLGIVSLSLGVLTILGCYCMPTAIALFVYGLIVYLNQPVMLAFDRAERGEPVANLLR